VSLVAEAEQESPLLAVRGVSKAFGGVDVLRDVSLTIRAGQRVSLIGSNGAGKTTLFNIITRLIVQDAGTVVFDGQDLSEHPPHHLIGLGLARTFQHAALFPSLSVLENITLPARTGSRRRTGGSPSLDTDHLVEILDLGTFMDTPIAQLPYAVQKRIEIARALVVRPRLLVLDEPAGGISRADTDHLQALLTRLEAEMGTSLLLIEHNMRFVMSLSEYIYVLDHGVLIASGKPTDIAEDPSVIAAYFGSPE
jgi:branched-chain amino acid transport system ATP-binding protein